jgi:hypothetical protein
MAAVVVALAVFLFHLPFSKNSFLTDDSADYLRAAQPNIGALYLNTDSASPIALRKLFSDDRFRNAPWDFLYFRGDNAAIRHFHAPFSFYVMHAVYSAGGSDRAQRLTVSVVAALTCALLTIGLAAAGVPLILASAGALLAGLQSRYIEVSVDPTPHSWYMLFAVTFLLLLSRFVAVRRTRDLMAAAVALGFAFATLEFSLELILSVPVALTALWITGNLHRAQLKNVCALLLRAIPVFLATTFVLWPGGWLRGGYLECYGVTGATVVFKNRHAFGEKLSAGILYDKLFAHHEAIFAIFLFFFAALIYLAAKKRIGIYSGVFASYTVIALALGVADHFRLSTYVSEFLLFLIPASALLLRDLLPAPRPKLRGAAIVLSCTLLLCAMAQEWVQRGGGMHYRPWLQPVFAGISADVPRGSTILVNDNLEGLYTYLPGYDYEPTADEGASTPRTAWRAAKARYFLLRESTAPPAGADRIASWPTYASGHTLTLYVTR